MALANFHSARNASMGSTIARDARAVTGDRRRDGQYCRDRSISQRSGVKSDRIPFGAGVRHSSEGDVSLGRSALDVSPAFVIFLG